MCCGRVVVVVVVCMVCVGWQCCALGGVVCCMCARHGRRRRRRRLDFAIIWMASERLGIWKEPRVGIKSLGESASATEFAEEAIFRRIQITKPKIIILN